MEPIMVLPTPEPLRVVIVDEEKDARDSLARLLKVTLSCDATPRDGGLSAIKAVWSTRPHLVFLDLDLPYINGFLLLELLRQVDSQNALMVAVSSDDKRRRRNIRTVQPFDYFELKPLRLTRLRELVAEARHRVVSVPYGVPRRKVGSLLIPLS
jgi:CheY-like chemotaxis protein